MIPGVHLEVILAAGYAAFLVGAAALLEMLARHSHRRTGQYQNAGFTYRERFDLWECPMGQQLARVEADHARRIVRYRAPAKVCNACSLKNNCTDSSEGRLLERRLDSWIDRRRPDLRFLPPKRRDKSLFPSRPALRHRTRLPLPSRPAAPR